MRRPMLTWLQVSPAGRPVPARQLAHFTIKTQSPVKGPPSSRFGGLISSDGALICIYSCPGPVFRAPLLRPAGSIRPRAP